MATVEKLNLERVDLSMNFDEEVVTLYLLKLFDLPRCDHLNKADLLYLTTLYADKLTYDIYKQEGNEELLEMADKTYRMHQQIYGDKLREKCEQSAPVPESHRTPVICWICKKFGHIARGCKHFQCHRCGEIGHVRAGCRKKRPKFHMKDPSYSTPVSEPAPASSVPLLDDQEAVVEHENPEDLCEPADADVDDDLVQDVPEEAEMTTVEDGWSSDGLHLEFDSDSVVGDRGGQDRGQFSCEDEVQSEVGQDDEVMDRGDTSVDYGEDSMDEDDDQSRPCWTLISEDVGVDCSDMVLSDFLEFLKNNPDVLDSQSKEDLVECIEEETAEFRAGLSKYPHLFQ